jgi:stage IV sporulation protein FA
MYAMDKRIKERRERLLHLLRDKSRFEGREEGEGYPPYRSFSHYDDGEPSHPLRNWLWQVPLSVLLVMGSFISFQTDHPYAETVQAWVKESLTREFNFAGAQAWYEERFAGSPSLLPQFKANTVALAPASETAVVFAPIRGQVLTGFQGEGITIQTNKEENQVVAMSDGWVTFVGEKEKLGLTVILRHAGGRETWYSYLQQVNVSVGDVIRGGQRIGQILMDPGQQEGLFYFSLKENNQFTDPLGVVQFDQ